MIGNIDDMPAIAKSISPQKPLIFEGEGSMINV